jgi:3-deoxy-manno-octulosonate cytidylyltransferase (CMP-KDO synthetase)
MIIIPARIGSTRFPRKVLVEIDGIPMVVATARRGAMVDKVVVATDSQEVIEVCEEYGIEAILTSPSHPSGSDRVMEAVEILGLKGDEVIVNLQGDEPLIEPEILEKVKNRILELERPFKMATCCKKITPQEAQNPNIVKVVVDKNWDALYFSRSPIPYPRGEELEFYWGHLGIYAFSVDSLKKFVKMKGELEHIEKLEQLRVLENGEKISVVPVESQAIGVDTPHDLQKVHNFLRRKK